MAYSKTCKLLGLGAIGISSILILVIIYSFRPRLCPKEGELFYRPHNKCYPREAKGPCANNLIILEAEAERSQVGECSCPFTQFNRTLLYNSGDETCYFVFTQAYCEQGQWLSIKQEEGNKWTPFCESNRCINSEEQSEDYSNINWVPLKGGTCGRLGFYEEGCPSGSVVRFHKDYILPSCHTPPKKPKHKIGSIGVPASNCQSGSYPSIMGKCQPVFEFDFD